MTAAAPLPRVAVLVLNYNGWRFLPACLRSLAATDYPPELLDVVVIDNASSDHSVARLRAEFPNVRVLALKQNLGFAGGNNAGIVAVGGDKETRRQGDKEAGNKDTREQGNNNLQRETRNQKQEISNLKPDYIVLLNNDTAVDPGWLLPLVRAAEADPTVGACGAKLLFFYASLPLRLEIDGAFVPAEALPGNGDTRVLGVRLAGVNLPSDLIGAHVAYAAGWYDQEGVGDGAYRWSSDRAVLDLPVADHVTPLRLTLRFAGGPPAPLPPARVRLLVGATTLQTMDVGSEPVTVDVCVPPELLAGAQRFIQNAGQELVSGGYCRDRGSFVANGVEQRLPDGSFERQEEVFGVCGAAVLLRRAMLDQIGLLDHDFFMYYEDTDLSWRARWAGWRMIYVPQSVVRHIHSGSSGAWSPMFRFHVERNRLLMLIKNAPADLARRAMLEYARETGAWIGRSARALRHDRQSARRSAVFVGNNVRVLLSLGRLLPAMLRKRQEIRRHATVTEAAIMHWMIDP